MANGYPSVKSLEQHCIEAGAAHAVLALDLATKTGFALRHVDGVIAHGTWQFEKGTHPGLRFRQLRRQLTQINNTSGGLGRVFYEKVQFSGGKGQQTQMAAQLFGGWEALLLDFCCLKGIEVEGINVSTIKKFITNNGHAPKTEAAKHKRNDELRAKGKSLYDGPTVESAIKDRGFYPEDDNAGDALAVLLYGLNEMGITEWLPGPVERRLQAAESF